MDIKNFGAIENISSNKTSLAKVLLIFYIILASNYTHELLSKQLREYIESNRLVQHIIGLMMMVILVTSVGGIVDTYQAILYSVIGYIWFLFTTKMDIHWNMIALIILFIGYMFENTARTREEEAKSDPNLSEEERKKILRSYELQNRYIIFTILLVSIIGTIMYTHKKQGQYGGGYNFFTYLLY